MHSDALQVLLPGMLGFGASVLCPVGERAGVSVPQRPPSYVFGIVWPTLYLLIGYSLKETKDKLVKRMFAALLLLLTLWPVVFSTACGNDRKSALYLLAMIIGVTVGIMSLHEKRLAIVALVPLLSWCMIAYLLNWDLLYF